MVQQYSMEKAGHVQGSNAPRQRVLRSIRLGIERGHLSPGERLASEELLAAEHGVSRGTVRAALEQLEQEGLIIVRKSKGRIVSPAAAGRAMLAKSFVLVSALGHIPEVQPGHHSSGNFEIGIMAKAAGSGMHPIILNKPGLTDGYFESLLNGHPLGVMVCDGFHDDQDCLNAIARAHASGLSVAVYGDKPELAKYDRVISDHEKGATMLTEEFLRRGCRRILRLWTGGKEPYWIKARNRGFEKILKQAGLSPMPPVYANRITDRGENHLATFSKRVRHYAGYLVEHLTGDKTIDGLMLTSDSDLFPAAAACRLFGREPGRDILLCGYDNYWHECRERELEKSEPIASVDKCNQRLGQELFNLFLQRIEKKDKGPNGQGVLKIIDPELIVNG